MAANLAVFYNGSVSFKEIGEMPIPAMLNLNEFAARINEERQRQVEKD